MASRKQSPQEKLEKKRLQLVERTALALRIPQDEARTLLAIPRAQSIRLNTLRADAAALREKIATMDVSLTPVPWFNEGIYVDDIRAIRDSELPETGDVYIQNAASWLPVLALNPQQGEAILDVCAAPGGKTSHIAQHTDNQAFITANDNSRPRLHRLQANLDRLGAQNVTYTLHDATRLASHFELGQFDRILLDAPCSGEGMMTLDDKKAFESWSVAHIKRLQQLQKRILVQAWQLLKPGGMLVYSTCTMAPEENEAVVDYLLRHNDNAIVQDLEHLRSELPNATSSVIEWNGRTFDARLNKALRLTPSREVEAFFVVALTKVAAPTD